jgi:nucleoside-diphosphate-sugar epimerase
VRISEIHSTKPKSVYGKSKLLFESYILDSKIFEQSSIVVIRPFNIVGRNTQKMRSESVISKILDCIASEEKFEFRTTSDNETPIRDYIDVTDVSELIVRSATFQKEAGLIIVNACTGRGTNLRELIAECENIAIGMNTQNGMRLNTEKKSLSESEILNSIGDPSSANLKFDWFARISLKESILMEYR